MNLALVIRRNLVIVGVVSALVLGAATVRAAAVWTAASAPLEEPPAALSSIREALTQEKERSAVLEQQLADLTQASDDLAAALEAARTQVATDSQTADTLRASLAAAQQKLAKLEAALKAAQSIKVTTVGTTSTATTTYDDHDGDDDGGEHDDD
jgi:septal ring factor EnvC (AmiA/AmiB activator)